MKTVGQMLIFDVDGVITDPQEKKITQLEIIDEIIKRIEMGEPVALNTGRSIVWLMDRVINPLLNKIKNKIALKKFFASGEKGATWITFDENGEIKYHKDESISVPKSIQVKIRNLINSEFSESMFYDETKKTMISTEMKDGFSVEKYSELQICLNEKIKLLLNKDNFSKRLKVDPTVIATDVENVHVGKGFAIERILKWLDEKKLRPQKFITFGDSLSDLPMPEKLHEKGKNVEFIFVGKNIIKKPYPFSITDTKELYEKGTVEALKNL
jgi:hydroxymethylpyrimidine pyrophosphatase-like HAD family hydrolase